MGLWSSKSDAVQRANGSKQTVHSEMLFSDVVA